MFYNDCITKPCIILGTIVAFIAFYTYIYDGTEYIQSTYDKKYYKVRSNDRKQENADLLAILNIKFDLITSSLNNNPKYKNITAVQRLIKNWNKGVSIKEIGKMESDAAYVINKQYMSFCLPESTNKSIDNLNLMTYVGIHELAHIMSNETGHGEEFIQNFQFLLDYAKLLKYYDPILQKEVPVYIQLNKLNTADNYCGVQLINSIN